jgi:hypothetical protein
MNINVLQLEPSLNEPSPDFESLGLGGYCEPQWYKPLAERICASISPTNILEIGFFFGASSYCWLSSSSARVVSCDIIGDAAPDCLKVIRNSQNLASRFDNRLTLIPKSSQFIYNDICHIPFDLAFIDGRHDYNGVIEDLDLCYRLGVKYVLLDDFNGEVSRAWAQKYATRYPAMYGVRFVGRSTTGPIDCLLTQRSEEKWDLKVT